MNYRWFHIRVFSRFRGVGPKRQEWEAQVNEEQLPQAMAHALFVVNATDGRAWVDSRSEVLSR